MNKNYSRIASLLLVILITCICELNAQNRVNSIEELKEFFTSEVSEQYQEKIFIHTDRSMYITGETIWLKPYCVDATFHTPSNLSKIVNVELFNAKGIAVKQVRIQLEEGVGQGQLFVSPDIESGTYVLRAYTNWMKNFDPEFAFNQTISIINPTGIPVIDTESRKDSANLNVVFLPEGGDLVEGLESRIAVKVNDAFGQGIRLTGIVFDDEENEVAKFSTSENGLSSFQLLPKAGHSYLARVSFESKVYKFNIPEARTSGLTIAANTNSDGDFDIEVKATQDFLQTMYLIVHTRGLIKKIEPLYPKVSQNIMLKTEDLDDGITHLTILNSNFRPIAERLLFKYPEHDSLYELKTNKKVFSKREKINLTIKTELLDPKANISVSVSRSDSSLQDGSNIVSNLLLTSDLTGEVLNAGSYFSNASQEMKKQLDLIMLTNGWRRFDWHEIVNQQERILTFPAEMNAPIISGKMHNDENQPLQESLKMSFMGKASFLNSIEIDSSGYFNFEVPFRIKNEQVILFTDIESLSKESISLFSPFAFDYSSTKKVLPYFNADLKGYIESLNTNIQISQVYRPYNMINGSEILSPDIKSEFYGPADQVYFLDNYTRFETVEDLFIEYIRFAYIKTKNKKRSFYVLSENGAQVEALATIDGIPIFDAEFLLDFDPLKVEKISMVNNYYFIGSVGYRGLLNFSTYNGDFAKQELPEGIVEKAYTALQIPREFYSPNYAIHGVNYERIPDYRNTLFWQPNVSIDKSITQLEFYTSDDPGLYKIQIEGLSKEGRPFFLVDYINITGGTP